ncbi:MAG: type I restriction-modification enzyme R subunit C-terminal domain-containing protein, partial [Sulfurimicrobium sp.]|nr:type I restriction-modification enzyme R subunit C-terminal domain-containing protein [Sulfurimicrobium sp.]
LADSLPKQRLIAWREARADWLTRNPRPWSAAQETDYTERFSARIESWLDAGAGSCALANPQARELMETALRHFDGERYRLGKYVVAANHVHVIVTPLPGHELSAILHSWKSYTAKQILQSEAASGRLPEDASSIWQKESYDRIVRSSEELFRIEHYIQRHSEYELSVADKRRDAASTAMQQARTIASKPLCDPALRQLILDIKAKNELTIDHVSQDQVIEAGFSQAALDRAKGLVKSFEQFIADHKDEITALQILYSKPYKQRLTFEAVKELADAIEKPPYLWNESQLWQAYAALEASKVKGASAPRILTDLVSLVRFAIHQDNELVPFPERVNANFKAWVEAASR